MTFWIICGIIIYLWAWTGAPAWGDDLKEGKLPKDLGSFLKSVFWHGPIVWVICFWWFITTNLYNG